MAVALHPEHGPDPQAVLAGKACNMALETPHLLLLARAIGTSVREDRRLAKQGFRGLRKPAPVEKIG